MGTVLMDEVWRSVESQPRSTEITIYDSLDAADGKIDGRCLFLLLIVDLVFLFLVSCSCFSA